MSADDYDDILAMPDDNVAQTEQPSAPPAVRTTKELLDAQRSEIIALARELEQLGQDELDSIRQLGDPALAEQAAARLLEITKNREPLEAKLAAKRGILARQLEQVSKVNAAEALEQRKVAAREAKAAIGVIAGENIKLARQLDAAMAKVVDAFTKLAANRARIPHLARDAGVAWAQAERYLMTDLLELGAWGHFERAVIARQLPQIPRLISRTPPVAWTGAGGGQLTATEYATLLAAGLNAEIERAQEDEA